ncbi:hypothetical protein VHEMI08953 [[Torrubiella] hemipterigena]|uniref:Peptidase S8/S53 domain-containing protein n=1 Tax=[Torrubiella] hemipterigena TaxID=1531966 RepID=A0A0A1T8D8_9HYPO|nr:hypothetical protein VHEMI08953 [[Torrubiella] hemipterigena]
MWIVKQGFFAGAGGANDNKDAANYSPAREPSACTVGAAESDNQKASYSNWGSIVDIQPPGSQILSAIPNGESKAWSGTSMACPHVVGVAALLISADEAKGADACDKMKKMALKDIIQGIPSGTTKDLLFNDNPGAK